MNRSEKEKNSLEHSGGHDLNYREYIGAVDDRVKSLQPGFPAYCIYIPTGMNQDFEIKVLTKLKEWGITMGENLLVADWDIGDPSYRVLARKLGIRQLPTIVLTDNNNPDRESFLIVIDEPSVVRDADTLVETLPNLVTYILAGDSNAAKEAVKDWIRKRQGSKIKAFLKPISSTLNKVETIKVSFSGVGLELKFK